MQRLLIILGLVIIPFYEIFIHALPFVRTISPDSRVTKEILALIFSLSIGLLAVWQGTLKPFKNKFFLIIPVYLLFNIMMSPNAPLNINNNEVGDFYFWKPFSEVLCFSFMIIAISSIEINFERILKVMVICGTVMAGYVILQKFGFDQFWLPKTGGEFTSVKGQLLGGNLGQPTIVASWIVMMVPLSIYLRKWWMSAVMIIACLLTKGAMVTGALSIIGIIYLFRKFSWSITPTFVIFSVLIYAIFMSHSLRNNIEDRMDGRLGVWENTLKDIRNGQIMGDNNRYPYTGAGFGRFSFSFPVKHPMRLQFMQAHNDPLEFAYNCGLIGEYLLLAGIFVMLIITLFHSSYIVFSIALSFVAIFICSLGSFPFQLGAHQFYSAVLVGLLHNEKLIGRNT